MEIDHELIVRKCIFDDAGQTYSVESAGSFVTGHSPPVAASGRYKRVIERFDKPDQVVTDNRIAFVSLTSPMNEDQYLAATADPWRPDPNNGQLSIAKAASQLLNADALSIGGQPHQRHPIASQAGSTSEMYLRRAIVRLKKPDSLSSDQFLDLKQSNRSQYLPPGYKLRTFIRYNDGQQMQHGVWVRLFLERTGRTTFCLPIRSYTVFSRPLTQLERLHTTNMDNSSDARQLDPVATWFDGNPHIGKSPELFCDFTLLTEAVRTAIQTHDFKVFRKLFGPGAITDKKLADHIRREFEMLTDKELVDVTFQRKQCLENPKHWWKSRFYEPNTPVEGYVQIKYSDRKGTDIKELSLEAGTSTGQASLVHYVPQTKTKADQTAASLAQLKWKVNGHTEQCWKKFDSDSAELLHANHTLFASGIKLMPSKTNK